jgi:hypothetical protein
MKSHWMVRRSVVHSQFTPVYGGSQSPLAGRVCDDNHRSNAKIGAPRYSCYVSGRRLHRALVGSSPFEVYTLGLSTAVDPGTDEILHYKQDSALNPGRGEVILEILHNLVELSPWHLGDVTRYILA